MLNRTLSWRPDGIGIEADRGHDEIAIQQLGLVKAKEVATPGVKKEEMTEEEIMSMIMSMQDDDEEANEVRSRKEVRQRRVRR